MQDIEIMNSEKLNELKLSNKDRAELEKDIRDLVYEIIPTIEELNLPDMTPIEFQEIGCRTKHNRCFVLKLSYNAGRPNIIYYIDGKEYPINEYIDIVNKNK